MSTLLSFPTELLHQILQHTVMESNLSMLNRDLLRSQLLRHSNTQPENCDLLTWASKRHPIISTCRKLQTIGMRIFLGLLHLTWECDLSGQVPQDANTISTILEDVSKLNMLDALGSIGVMFEDYWLHTVMLSAITNDVDSDRSNRKEWELCIRQSCVKAVASTKTLGSLTRRFGLRDTQVRVCGRYGTIAYTDGNALPAIKKALRKTWKRDIVSVSIYPWDIQKSQEALDEAMTMMEKELRDGTSVIEQEIEEENRREREKGSVTSPWENHCAEFLNQRRNQFEQWCDRVRLWHECLVGIVEEAYMGEKEHF